MSTTTIVIPASVTLREPEGDPGGADTLATELYRASSRYDEFATEATQLRDLGGGWSGDAYDAYAAASGRASSEHEGMARTVERVARAVTAYADALREHRRTYDGLVDEKAAADRTRTDLVADVNAAQDVSPTEITALEDRAQALRIRYLNISIDHATLHRQVRTDEDLLREAFTTSTSLTDAVDGEGGIPTSAVTAINQPGAPGSGASPEETAAWWEGLTDEEQSAVLAAYPHRLGGADGLPASVRDDANRILLDDDLATLGAKEDDGVLTPDEQQVLTNAREAQRALELADSHVDAVDGSTPGGQLWLYDPAAFDGDGRVGIAVGDLDQADNVAVFTPGITTNMESSGDYAGQMANLYDSTRYTTGGSVATMFWLGYDAPDAFYDPATLSEGRAEDGGERLADAVAGLRASREDDPAHMTAIGHSYGSTTTSYAAVDHDLQVDEVALIGSPGAGPAEDADDFSVGADNVYVGRDSRDLVATLGDEGWVGKGGIGLGNDPSEDEFGATRFEAEDVDRWAIGYNFTEAHSSYLDPNSESLYNLGLIVGGEGDHVNEAEHSYDPWYGEAEDPEYVRDPTEGEEGRSRTQPGS